MLNFTLLYVEDDDATRERLGDVLAHFVKKVYIASDALEALEIFKNHDIHCVLSDFKMPNMNGNELCRTIKSLKPSLPFILLTAFNDAELLIEAINSRVDHFLLKPVMQDSLMDTLQSINHTLVNQFNLERSKACLLEAEKIAHLAYLDIDFENKQIYFSKEVVELFNIDLQLLDTDSSYKILLEKVSAIDKVRFNTIFQSRIFTEHEIDEVITIDNESKNPTYMRLAIKRWESSIYGKHHAIGIFQDISRYEIERLRLLEESQHDPLLNIANKKFLIHGIDKLIALASRYDLPFSVLFLDIDNFKKINEKFGHIMADEILIELSKLIQSHIRENDYFGRWGGDEFVIVLDHTNLYDAAQFGNRLIHSIASYRWCKDISVKISIGAAEYKKGDNTKNLLDRADSLLFQAKQNGKNSLVSSEH
jgi:diguanylate cyclase (GGDEF)-like protein